MVRQTRVARHGAAPSLHFNPTHNCGSSARTDRPDHPLMDPYRLATQAAILLSLVAVPAALTGWLHLRGMPAGDPLRLYALAGVALAPGILMGGAGLLVAARG